MATALVALIAAAVLTLVILSNLLTTSGPAQLSTGSREWGEFRAGSWPSGVTATRNTLDRRENAPQR